MRLICQLMIFPLFILYLIKENLIYLIERTFQREGSLYLACNNRNAFLRLKGIKGTHYGLARRCVKPSYFFWTIFISDLALSYTEKL